MMQHKNLIASKFFERDVINWETSLLKSYTTYFNQIS